MGYLNYEMPQEGLQLWSHAAAMLPQLHRLRFELAMVDYAMGQYFDGLQEIEQALTLVPDDPAYLTLRRQLREASSKASGVSATTPRPATAP